MRVVELAPSLCLAVALVCSVLAGIGAVALADRLPGAYGIQLLVVGKRRTVRNLVVMFVTIAGGLGLGAILNGADVPIGRAAVFFFTNLLLVAGLAASAAVDFEHMVLPNELTLGGAVLALATSPWRIVGWKGALIGAAIGLFVSVVPAIFYKVVRGHSGVGLGDAKLAIMAGAWHGPVGALFVLLAGAVQSLLCAVVMRVLDVSYTTPPSVLAEIEELRRKAAAGDEDAKAELADDPMAVDGGEGLGKMRLPLGPFLALASIEFLFARPWITELVGW